MSVTLRCPTCSNEIAVPPETTGKVGRCPHCQTRIRLGSSLPPRQSVEPTPEPAESPEFQAFIERMQAPATAAVTVATLRRRREPSRPRKSVAGLATGVGDFLLVIAAIGAWAFNAARSVSSFRSAVVPESSISLADFRRIQNGMNYRDVVNVLGSDGELVSQNQLDVPKMGANGGDRFMAKVSDISVETIRKGRNELLRLLHFSGC
jgi:DNA-directed RNA polymerase subunit RPC12/RpoP